MSLVFMDIIFVASWSSVKWILQYNFINFLLEKIFLESIFTFHSFKWIFFSSCLISLLSSVLYKLIRSRNLKKNALPWYYFIIALPILRFNYIILYSKLTKLLLKLLIDNSEITKWASVSSY